MANAYEDEILSSARGFHRNDPDTTMAIAKNVHKSENRAIIS